MNNETIEKAANAYSDKQFWIEEDYYARECMDIIAPSAFIAGAQWRINSVWHSPEEEPKADECIIVEKELFEGKYSYDCWKIDSGCAWDKESDYFCVTRWAYVRDLVPDTGKEAAL